MNRLVGILFALVLLCTCPTWGQEAIDYAQSEAVAAVAAEVPEHAEPMAEEQGIDVKTVVLEHITDSYEWHICTVGEHHVTIPLPVIVRSQSGEWHCFSSSHLHAGHEYEGFRIADEGAYAGKIVEQTAEGEVVRPIDLSITKTVAAPISPL